MLFKGGVGGVLGLMRSHAPASGRSGKRSRAKIAEQDEEEMKTDAYETLADRLGVPTAVFRDLMAATPNPGPDNSPPLPPQVGDAAG